MCNNGYNRIYKGFVDNSLSTLSPFFALLLCDVFAFTINMLFNYKH